MTLGRSICIMLAALATASALLYVNAAPRESLSPHLSPHLLTEPAPDTSPAAQENLTGIPLASQAIHQSLKPIRTEPSPFHASGDVHSTRTPDQTLHRALTLGFSHEELLALAREADPQALVAFFETHTHINPDWLHAQGLDEDVLATLYALWGAGASDTERSQATERAYISRFSPRQDGGPLRLQDSFQPTERTLYLHYSVPESYGRDSILVRWTGGEGNTLQHFDWHALTDAAGILQEAWYRPSHDWAPGDYHVEVYAIGSTPELLSSITFTVD